MDIVRDLGELTELAAEIPGVLDCLQGFRPAPGDGFPAIFPLGAAGTPEPGSIFALLVEAIETDPHWKNDPYLGLAHWRLWQSAHEAAATLLGRAAAEAEGLNDDYEFPRGHVRGEGTVGEWRQYA